MLQLGRIVYSKNDLCHPFNQIPLNQIPPKPLPSICKTSKHTKLLRLFCQSNCCLTKILLLVPKHVYISCMCYCNCVF